MEETAPKFAAVGQNAQVALSWEYVPGALRYKIWRFPGPVFVGEFAAATTQHIDIGLTNGTQYGYQLTATNDYADNDTDTAFADAIPTAATATPGAPTSLTAMVNKTDVTLNWTAASGTFTTYSIFRSTTPGTYSATPLATKVTPNTSYIDKNLGEGKTYYYVVKATNAGGSGPASNQASATIAYQSPPANVPTHFRALGGDTKVLLSWDAYPGATSYNLWRSSNGSSYSNIASIPSGTSYIDSGSTTGLTNGTNYGYALSASGPGFNSEFAHTNATPSAVAPLAPLAPQISAVTNTTLTATLPALSFGATSLTLQKKLSTEPITSFANVLPINQAPGTAFPLSGLTTGLSYDFRSVAVNAHGSTPGASVRVLMSSGGALSTTWTVGDAIASGGIMFPTTGMTTIRSTLGKLNAYAATDWDSRYINNLFEGVYSDTCSYIWSASGGSFPNGTTGQSVSWLAPATPNTYTISLTVDDQNGTNKANADLGGRNDASLGFNDAPLRFRINITVQ